MNDIDIQKRIEGLKQEQHKLEKESLRLLQEKGGKGHFSIRPAGRHVLTIGEDLIQDPCAAIVELVKNAYDADSKDVYIDIERKANDKVHIEIRDSGHGMTAEDIVNKWLVPSTDNKFIKRLSPKGRMMQGKKGIGRYAVSILGNLFSMKTTTMNGESTEVTIDWEEFKRREYLDQVEVELESQSLNGDTGTCIEIDAVGDKAQYWDLKRIKNLLFQLKKIIVPDGVIQADNEFKIYIRFDGYSELSSAYEEIEPYPILELYDYRITGYIKSDGIGELRYSTQKVKNSSEEVIRIDLTHDTNCGDLEYDIRVFDRETPSIESLIQRGLKDSTTNNYVSINEAKNLLALSNGIGVYRNGFRIRPLGDPEFDWLTLNKKRVQNPSKKLGSDQVAGFVLIQSEEFSRLEEKSARDGLRDNDAYDSLKDITLIVINELENRRFALRRDLGLSRNKEKVEKQLEGLYDYENLKKEVSSVLKRAKVSDETQKEICESIDEEQRKNNAVVEDIKNTVAVYQGQATLGKITNVVLHEGRKSIAYFMTQKKNLELYTRLFIENQEQGSLTKIIEILEGYAQHSQILIDLFDRMDPLRAKKRSNRKAFYINKSITESFAVFREEIERDNINVKVDCSVILQWNGWKQDFVTIFVNLIENSIYWMKEKKTEHPMINVTVRDENDLEIIYRDNGPGIEQKFIETEIIFDPEFSTKVDGTGLGLAIAGEAATRNGLVLQANYSDMGASFILRKGKENIV